MPILHLSLTTPTPLSSAEALSTMPLTTKLSRLSFTHIPSKTRPIRMGGGPRTYPGGVSKWQWKRMQAKKATQLLKARLARERQIYEMRKRAELKAAVSELERPWEAVEKPPNLFSVSADDQLQVLADRFQKPGGLDLWSEKDGPELFRPDNGLPSSRFFPKGVVHSVKPYGKISKTREFESSGSEEDSNTDWGLEIQSKGYLDKKSRSRQSSLDLNDGNEIDARSRSSSRNLKEGGIVDKGNRRKHSSDSEQLNSRNGYIGTKSGRNYSASEVRRSRGYQKSERRDSEVFDMSLQNDGSYGFKLDK